MNRTEITWRWEFTGAVHIGTGLARAGEADSLIRLKNGKPAIPGDAVKGVIRGSAERLARWLGADWPEQDDSSAPSHPIFAKIFGSGDGHSIHRFEPAEYVTGGELVHVSQTAIDSDRGSARAGSLRVSEMWSPGAEFQMRLVALGAAADPASDENLLLLAAIIGVEQIGGRRGTGGGAVRLSSQPHLLAERPLNAEALARIRKCLGLERHETGEAHVSEN